MDKQETQRVGELIRQAVSNTATRFRLPVTEDEAFYWLGVAYRGLVENRGAVFRQTRPLTLAVERIATLLTSETPPRGLLMMGSVGGGKTTLATALAKTARVLWQTGRFDAAAYGFRHDGDFCFRQRSAVKLYHLAHTDRAAYLSDAEWPLLILDDIGEEPAELQSYGNTVRPVSECLASRYERGLFTVLTTNLDPEGLRKHYGARIYDRIKEHCAVVNFGTAESFRTAPSIGPMSPMGDQATRK